MNERRPEFKQLYEEYAPHVWRVARHFGVPSTHLPDLAQEVWLSVFHQLPGLDLARPLRPWLTAVVWNHVRHLRRSYARRVRKDEALVDAETLRQETSEVPQSQREACWILEGVLGALPSEQREVLLLCEGEGMSAPEVSEALGIRINTVYSRLRLARTRCKALTATLGVAALSLSAFCMSRNPSPNELRSLGMALAATTSAMPPKNLATIHHPTKVNPAVYMLVAAAAALVVALGLRDPGEDPLVRVEPSARASHEDPDASTLDAPSSILAYVAPPSSAPPRNLPLPATPARAKLEAPRQAKPRSPAAKPVPPQASPLLREPALSLEVPSAELPSEEVSSTEVSPPPPVAPPEPTHPPRSANSLAAENQIIRDAQAAQLAGNLTLALAYLTEHLQDFPRGASADTRDLMRVQIHCDRGNKELARAIAQTYPNSHQFADKIARHCGATR